MVEIGGQIGGQVTGYAVEVLERFQQRRRLRVHRLEAYTTVPEGHGASLGSLMIPFSMTAVMLMASNISACR